MNINQKFLYAIKHNSRCKRFVTNIFLSSFPIFLGINLLFSLKANATANITIQPISWHIIGLDSNKVTDGPDTFNIGARVCNVGTSDATNVQARFVFDNSNQYINLTGSDTLTLDSLPAGATSHPPGNAGAVPNNCRDFYFNVVITRNRQAYDESRLYRIEATADGLGTVSTPSNRELYVEKLVSQNRNSVLTFDGPTVVEQGKTYTYTVTGETAPGGYEQLVFATNFPNTFFEILSVNTTYTTPSGTTNNANYGDGCAWDPNIGQTAPKGTYRSCVGPVNYGTDGKVGGDFTTTYQVKIIGTGSASVTNLVYDFSGSSYHYNSDYGTGVNTKVVTAVEASSPDLTISKTDGNIDFNAGSTGSYSLTVNNTGNADTSGTITVTDSLPTGLSVADGSLTVTGANAADWTCTASGNTITCTSNAVIAISGSSTFSFNVNVDNNAPASVTNNVSVSGGNEPAANNGNNTGSDTTNIISNPDLTISKTDGNTDFNAGSTGSYSLTVNNTGNAATSGTITVTDSLPTGLSVADGSLTVTGANAADWTCTASGNTITCTSNAVIAISGSSTFSFNVNVDNNAPASVTNNVSVSGGNEPAANNGNNTGSDTTNIISNPDLTISKTDGNIDFNAGSTGSYSLTVNNTGNAATSGTITVTDSLPTGLSVADGSLTVTGANAADWTCTASGNTITCTSNAVIAISGSSTFSFNVNVDNNAPASVTNNVSVSGGNEPAANNGNNTGSDTTNIISNPDLTISKTDGNIDFNAGSTGSYSLTVSNTGNADTSGTITVTDTLPTGLNVADGSLTVTGANAADWTCTASGNTITCTSNAVIAISGSSTFSFNVNVDNNAPASVTNNVSVSGGNEPAANNGNNTGSDTTNIILPLASNPNVLLVKRITAINGNSTENPNDNTPLNIFVDDTTSSRKDDDNHPNWPSNYLIGAIDGGKVKPGEEIEYTIYFLSTGDNTASNVLMCDLVPENLTFLPTAYNNSPAPATATLTGADRGIVHSYNSNTVSISGIQDGDIAQYFPPGVEPSTVYANIDCDGDPNSNIPNINGAVVVNLGDLPHATTPGQSNSYGFVRFRGKVK